MAVSGCVWGCDIGIFGLDIRNLHAQPTHLRNTTRHLFLLPSSSLLWRSRGATSPMRGTGATLTGGGGGENHGWTLRGRDLGVIHEDQLLLLLSLLLVAFFDGEDGDVREGKSREVLERPTLRRAILVVREDIMADSLEGHIVGNLTI